MFAKVRVTTDMDTVKMSRLHVAPTTVRQAPLQLVQDLRSIFELKTPARLVLVIDALAHSSHQSSQQSALAHEERRGHNPAPEEAAAVPEALFSSTMETSNHPRGILILWLSRACGRTAHALLSPPQ